MKYIVMAWQMIWSLPILAVYALLLVVMSISFGPRRALEVLKTRPWDADLESYEHQEKPSRKAAVEANVNSSNRGDNVIAWDRQRKQFKGKTKDDGHTNI